MTIELVQWDKGIQNKHIRSNNNETRCEGKHSNMYLQGGQRTELERHSI